MLVLISFHSDDAKANSLFSQQQSIFFAFRNATCSFQIVIKLGNGNKKNAVQNRFTLFYLIFVLRKRAHDEDSFGDRKVGGDGMANGEG